MYDSYLNTLMADLDRQRGRLERELIYAAPGWESDQLKREIEKLDNEIYMVDLRMKYASEVF